jgi:hypothetical protein
VKRAGMLVLAIAAFYAAAVLWIAGDRRASRRVNDRYSAASTANDGLSLAYAYLQRRRGSVAMLTRSIAAARLPADSVVLRVGAQIPPAFEEDEEEEGKKPQPQRATPLLSPAEFDFAARGGRIVLAVPGGLPPLEFRGDAPPSADKVFPFTAGIERIAFPARRGIVASTLGPRMVALYAAGTRVAIARERIGRGDLIVVADPDIFTNAQLRAGNHLPLLLALCGTGRPLFFDETIHGLGSEGGILELLKEWGLGPFLLLLVAAGLLLFWRGSTRIGPPEDAYRDVRSDAVDLVHSLGALYQHSMTDAAALQLYHDALVKQVAAQTGLRGDALHQRVAAMTNGETPPRGRVSRAQFKQKIDALNAAFQKLHARGDERTRAYVRTARGGLHAKRR